MTRILTAVATLAAMIALVEPASAGQCKGLETAQCSATAGCAWRGALVKGETKTAKGEPSKVTRKAHCGRGKQQTAAKS